MRTFTEEQKIERSKRSREFYLRNPDRAAAATKKWREANPEKAKAACNKSYMKRTFGMSPEQYEAMLQTQGGGCAFCDQKPGGTRFDHDHTCGQCVRWLLCDLCNRALGMFKDDINVLERAATALRERQEVRV